jgi:nucleotide-binding universal stress UspA family protein
MFHKILAAIDTSPISRWVVNFASSLAKQSNAQLGLLYVLALDQVEDLPLSRFDTVDTLQEYPTSSGSVIKCYIGQPELDHLNGTDNPGLNLLKSYTYDAILQGVSAEFFQCMGDPGVAICDFAKAWQADLIVIGHRGRSGLAELLLGSVSNHVVHHAPCSVHIFRPSIQHELSRT